MNSIRPNFGRLLGEHTTQKGEHTFTGEAQTKKGNYTYSITLPDSVTTTDHYMASAVIQSANPTSPDPITVSVSKNNGEITFTEAMHPTEPATKETVDATFFTDRKLQDELKQDFQAIEQRLNLVSEAAPIP